MRSETDRLIAEAKAQLVSPAEMQADPPRILEYRSESYPIDRWEWTGLTLHVDVEITFTERAVIPKMLIIEFMRDFVEVLPGASWPVELHRSYNLNAGDKLELEFHLEAPTVLHEAMNRSNKLIMKDT